MSPVPQVARAVLVGMVVQQRAEEELVDLFSPEGRWSQSDLWDYESVTFGIIGSKLLWQGHATLGESWRDLVTSYYFRRYDLGGYTLCLALANLCTDRLPRLFSETFQIAEEVPSLYRQIFRLAGLTDASSLTLDGSLRSILYLEPSDRAPSNDVGTDNQKTLSDSAFVQAVCVKGFGHQRPTLLDDVLLFCGPGRWPPKRSLGIASTWSIPPAPPKAEIIRIPATYSLWRFIEYIGAIAVYEHLEHRLKALPFTKTRVEEYLAAHRMNPGETRTRYRTDVLSDREHNFRELLDIARIRENLNLKTRPLTKLARYSTTLLDPTLARSKIFSTPVLGSVTSALKDVRTQVSDLYRLSQSRERLLVSHLRELAAEEATEVNLKLQVAMRRLTIVGSIVAGLAILISAAVSAFPNASRQIICTVWSAPCRVENAPGISPDPGAFPPSPRPGSRPTK